MVPEESFTAILEKITKIFKVMEKLPSLSNGLPFKYLGATSYKMWYKYLEAKSDKLDSGKLQEILHFDAGNKVQTILFENP